jgi:hypothetical protein
MHKEVTVSGDVAAPLTGNIVQAVPSLAAPPAPATRSPSRCGSSLARETHLSDSPADDCAVDTASVTSTPCGDASSRRRTGKKSKTVRRKKAGVTSAGQTLAVTPALSPANGTPLDDVSDGDSPSVLHRLVPVPGKMPSHEQRASKGQCWTTGDSDQAVTASAVSVATAGIASLTQDCDGKAKPPAPPARRGYKRVTAVKAMLHGADTEHVPDARQPKSSIAGESESAPGRLATASSAAAPTPIPAVLLSGTSDAEASGRASKWRLTSSSLPLDTGVISTT